MIVYCRIVVVEEEASLQIDVCLAFGITHRRTRMWLLCSGRGAAIDWRQLACACVCVRQWMCVCVLVRDRKCHLLSDSIVYN